MGIGGSRSRDFLYATQTHTHKHTGLTSTTRPFLLPSGFRVLCKKSRLGFKRFKMHVFENGVLDTPKEA